jgi:hypothetical protein
MLSRKIIVIIIIIRVRQHLAPHRRGQNNHHRVRHHRHAPLPPVLVEYRRHNGALLQVDLRELLPVPVVSGGGEETGGEEETAGPLAAGVRRGGRGGRRGGFGDEVRRVPAEREQSGDGVGQPGVVRRADGDGAGHHLPGDHGGVSVLLHEGYSQ